jgi:hypothetical protein
MTETALAPLAPGQPPLLLTARQAAYPYKAPDAIAAVLALGEKWDKT